MSRKDYEMIARVLREERKDSLGFFDQDEETAERHAVNLTMDGIARRFARELAASNPRFDGHRFLAACGVTV